MLLTGLAFADSQATSMANSSDETILRSISARQSAELQEKTGGLKFTLNDAAGLLGSLLSDIWQQRSLLQRQLASLGSGLLTIRQLEREAFFWLALVDTWAATPDGAYCGGRVNQQAAAAGRRAFSAALELSDSDSCTAGLLVALSNLLRRTGAVAEAEATLRRAVAAARAAGDSFHELNAAASLAATIPWADGWRYQEVEGLVEAMQRCLRDCKPWLPSPVWTGYLEKMRHSENTLADERHLRSNSYARRPLPCRKTTPHTNTFVPDRAAKKVGTCSSCGGHFTELKFCARCRAAKYCSRTCQVAHWKAGHKTECAQLAAQREGGSSGASGSRRSSTGAA